VDFPQVNPFYDFVLSKGKTAHVEANTGQVTPFLYNGNMLDL